MGRSIRRCRAAWRGTWSTIPRHQPERFRPQRHEQLWQRLDDFLNEVLPVAEEAGVTLAAHPDDPPMPTMRGQPRLVYQPQLFQRLLDLQPSPANALEFCIGTIAEMTDGDVYEATDDYSRQGKLAYVHFRNVTGKVPHYRETFVDDGDVDMLRVLRILHRNGYQRRHHPRPHAANDVRRPVARRHGLRARLHESRASDSRHYIAGPSWSGFGVHSRNRPAKMAGLCIGRTAPSHAHAILSATPP